MDNARAVIGFGTQIRLLVEGGAGRGVTEVGFLVGVALTGDSSSRTSLWTDWV